MEHIPHYNILIMMDVWWIKLTLSTPVNATAPSGPGLGPSHCSLYNIIIECNKLFQYVCACVCVCVCIDLCGSLGLT